MPFPARATLAAFLLVAALAGCMRDEGYSHGCPSIVFEPTTEGGSVEFTVSWIDEGRYVLRDLAFRIDNGTSENVSGTFGHLLDHQEPSNVTYHDRTSPATELNLGDSVRVEDPRMSSIAIFRGQNVVGLTGGCD